MFKATMLVTSLVLLGYVALCVKFGYQEAHKALKRIWKNWFGRNKSSLLDRLRKLLFCALVALMVPCAQAKLFNSQEVVGPHNELYTPVPESQVPPVIVKMYTGYTGPTSTPTPTFTWNATTTRTQPPTATLTATNTPIDVHIKPDTPTFTPTGTLTPTATATYMEARYWYSEPLTLSSIGMSAVVTMVGMSPTARFGVTVNPIASGSTTFTLLPLFYIQSTSNPGQVNCGTMGPVTMSKGRTSFWTNGYTSGASCFGQYGRIYVSALSAGTTIVCTLWTAQ